MEQIKVFCPATIANISCGFDVLGLALDSVGDEMVIKKTAAKGVSISTIIGQDLPLDPKKNVAGVAGLAFLEASGYKGGFDIEIYKNIKPGSGIGSSAASAAGAVWGMNELLGRPFAPLQLVAFAMQGEQLASKVAHADNVAPALFGGFTLVRSYAPLDVVPIHTPDQLYASVVHPQIEVKTSDSRKVLKANISLQQGIRQWGNVGGLVAGLFTEDYALIARSLEDHVVEPIRSILIPAFDQVKKEAIRSGALGCGISGSGPSVFALSKGEAMAKKVGGRMAKVYEDQAIDFDLHISKINRVGCSAIT